MMKKSAVCLIALFSFAGALYSQVPGTLSYQGILLQSDGSAITDGAHTVVFNFYTASTGGSATLTRTISVTTSKGLYTCVIGDGSSGNAALPSSVGSQQLYIGINVDGGSELSPRAQLTTSPYSFQAQSAYSMNSSGLSGTVAIANGGTAASTAAAARTNLGLAIGTNVEAWNTNLDNLAGGSLTGSLVGSGINASNITTGTLNGSLVGSGINATNLTTGTLAGSLVGSGINGSNVTTGTISGSRIGAGIDGSNITSGTIGGSTSINTSGNITVSLTSGNAGYFFSNNNYGVYASSNLTDAGHFVGSVTITNGLFVTGGTKSFKIDHPLDPANKYLVHAAIESDEVMNLYNGIVVLDKNGEAIVTLPNWFQALNKDFRYQLTCVGGFAQVYIAEEVSNNSFKIAGGKSGMKVSWQITGVRNDPYIRKHPMDVELAKKGFEVGKYLNPKEYGVSETLGLNYEKSKEEKANINTLDSQKSKVIFK